MEIKIKNVTKYLHRLLDDNNNVLGVSNVNDRRSYDYAYIFEFNRNPPIMEYLGYHIEKETKQLTLNCNTGKTAQLRYRNHWYTLEDITFI